MMFRTVGPRSCKPTVQHAQATDLIDIELFPSLRRTTATRATDLKAEQTLDAMANATIVRFDDSDVFDSVDEFDQTLVSNRLHEIVIHRQDQRSPCVEGLECSIPDLIAADDIICASVAVIRRGR
jgi:hypothetical protein